MSISLAQSVASLQYVRFRVQAEVNGNPSYDPTADVVQFGFLPQGTTSPSTPPTTWVTGDWETTTLGGQTAYIARCLVGPGGTFVPTANTYYWVWLKVTDSPEAPVMQVGELRIT